MKEAEKIISGRTFRIFKSIEIMEKKYELTDEILEVGGRVLHRINALRNFGNIKQGEIGGWIENEDNLSHCGDCWVYGDAEVYGNAEVEKKIRLHRVQELVEQRKILHVDTLE